MSVLALITLYFSQTNREPGDILQTVFQTDYYSDATNYKSFFFTLRCISPDYTIVCHVSGGYIYGVPRLRDETNGNDSYVNNGKMIARCEKFGR